MRVRPVAALVEALTASGITKSRLGIALVLVVLGLAIAIPIAVAVSGADPDDDPALYEPEPTGPKVAVTSGTADGEPWALQAYPSDQGLCLELLSSRGARGGCGVDVSANEVGLFVAWDYEAGRTWIFGPATASADAVKIALDDGTEITTKTVPGPASLSTQLDFYSTAVSGTPAVGSVTAVDSAGSVLGRQVNG